MKGYHAAIPHGSPAARPGRRLAAATVHSAGWYPSRVTPPHCKLDDVMEQSKLINLILYGLLPLWGIAGFIDWCCHRATKVESTSGLKESLVHSVMGIQLGIPILLCLLFEINVLVLFICVLMWL